MQLNEALDAYLEAKKEYDAASANYDGYEKGYHLHRAIEVLDKAKEALNAFFTTGA